MYTFILYINTSNNLKYKIYINSIETKFEECQDVLTAHLKTYTKYQTN